MKIEKLSEEQLALIPQVREKWLEIGMDTAPVDRTKVREILGRLYALADRPVPKHIIHLDSPLQVSTAIANMRLENSSVSEEVSLEVSRQVSQEVRIMLVPQTIGQVLGVLNTFAKYAQVSEDVSDQVFNQIGLPVGSQLNRVYGRVQAAIQDEVRVVISGDFLDDFGQCDQLLPSCYFFGRIGIDVSKLEPAFDMAKNCGWSLLFWDWAFITAKPEYIKRDEQNLLHCETGPAVRYPDGFSVFAIHGVRVPEKVVVSPESITISEIESEGNAEVRRVMIERYGPERFLIGSGAKEIHRDDFGILFRKEVSTDEPLVMVKVVNSTPEPDGSYKVCFLRVPPTMQRARQAVAWTFGKEEYNYAPTFQT